MTRIGVFVCHCGTNIAGVVNVDEVVEAGRKMGRVAFVGQNKYMCSETGQGMLRQAIEEHGLDRVVVASCSPHMHERTFRRAGAQAGLNPFLVEMANIREHCSWVHGFDKPQATAKAIDTVEMMVAKVRRDEALFPREVGLERRALVIGGGIAGIQAALDIANAGYEVVLVERDPSIGGRMAQLDKTFPTLDCSSCILTPRMVDVRQHPLITLRTYAEVRKVSGFVGNFEVEILERARHVDSSACTGCGTCWQKCPEKVPSEFDVATGDRKAIYVPFAQAVPNVPVIDLAHCRYARHLAAKEDGVKIPECRICEKLCPSKSIRWDQEDRVITDRFGTIVVATGFQPFDYTGYGEYGGGRLRDVVSTLQLERMLSASGPTGGEVVRPSDGRHPKTVVFVSCVGSRDERMGRSYCSKVCCMVMAKQAILMKEHDPEVESYIFYIDVRAGGKGYEEFVRRAQEEHGAMWLRGRISKIYEDQGKVIVRGEDSLIGRPVEIAADLVVLAVGIVPSAGAVELAQVLNTSYDNHNFFVEAHPKLQPLETRTEGIFLAGTASGPRDIPESVAQGSGVAAKAIGVLSKPALIGEAMTSVVDPLRCVACFSCERVCPYNAVEHQELRGGRIVASVNDSVCKGCGLCATACRGGAINLRGFSHEQLMEEVIALCR